MSQVKFVTHIKLLLLIHEKKKYYIIMKSLISLTNPKTQWKNLYLPLLFTRVLNEIKFIEHEEECSVHTPIRVRFNSDEGNIKFKNYDRQRLHQFVVYADFERTLQSIDTCEPNSNEPYTNWIQKHKPNSFCCYAKCEIDNYTKLEI